MHVAPRSRFGYRHLRLSVLVFMLALVAWLILPDRFRLQVTAHAASPTSLVDPIALSVNTLGDAADTNVGDGHCDTDGNLANGDQCTLRAAIQETNSSAGDDTIYFSLPANSTITLNAALPDLNNLTIAGPGAELLTVQRSTVAGTTDFRIFTVGNDRSVSLSGLTISNGSARNPPTPPAVLGGGVLNNTGTLIVSNCAITGNKASSGGGLANLGRLTVLNSTIANNSVLGTGGGIANSTGDTQTAVLTISNSTINNNSAGEGGGIYNIGQASISNTTISSNTAMVGGGISNLNPMKLSNGTVTGNNGGSQAGGIFNPGIGILTFDNTIIAGNTSPSGPDCKGANFLSQDYNLIGNTGGAGFTGTTSHNITNVDARLGALGNNGGPTPTHELLDGSPAIDAGNSPLTTDQRGQARPADHANVANAVGGNASDIGAYEAPTFQVNSIADTDDGACTLPGAGNGCTLREAINAANTAAGAELITFAPALTAAGPATITLLSALPDLASDMTITGAGASLLTVERSRSGGISNFRIFSINSGKTVNISGLTISNGNMTLFGQNGGGVLNNGRLKLEDCNIFGNNSNSLGGGIYTDGPSLTVNKCNIGGLAAGQPNSAGASGGGIFQESGTFLMTGGSIVGNSGDGIATRGTATLDSIAITNNVEHGNGGAGLLVLGTTNINNCLIANNTAAGGDGGGIRNSNATLKVTNSTISGNSTIGSGGGFFNFNATATLTNVTVTNNRSVQAGGGFSPAGGSAFLNNTIVAGNFRTLSSGTFDDDLSVGASATSSYNLIGHCDFCGLSNGVNNNQVGVANPRLGPLADNGGPTLTHALLAGSPALDAGSNTFVANPPFSGPPFTEQRGTGFNRIVDSPDIDTTATVDIGAFETQVALGEIADMTINEDATAIVPFDVGDPALITSVTATSDNVTLAPNIPANISVAGSSSTRVLTINPATNMFGAANITVIVNTTSGSASRTFGLTVNPVNDAPSFTRGPDANVNEDAGPQTVVNWASNMSAGPANESGQTVTFEVAGNTNPALFSAAPAISTTGTLTFTPAANANGSATVSVVLKDNGGAANGGTDSSPAQTLVITVNPVNDAPSFSSGPVVTVNEDAGPQTVANWAKNISAGPPNESGQTLTFQLTGNNNPGLFSSGPAISSTGTLTFTTAPNANGSAFMFISLKDNGGTANNGVDTSSLQILTIIVNAVNDPPVNTVPGPQSMIENRTLTFSDANLNLISIADLDASTARVSLAATNGTLTLSRTTGLNFTVGNGTANATMTFTGTLPNINAALNGLVFTPTAGFDGAASLQIVTNDQGSSGSGGTMIDTDTVNISVLDGGTLQFSAATFSVNENGGVASIVVTRSTSFGAASVNYATANGSATGGSACGPGVNYVSSSGTVSWADGDSNFKTFTIPICDDSLTANGTVNLSLSNAQGSAALGTQTTATLTIINDGPPVILTELNSDHAVAFESVMLTRDPFSLLASANFNPDRRTRIVLFVWGLGFRPSDNLSDVFVQAEDVSGNVYALPVEYLSPAPGLDGTAEVIVLLPQTVPGAPKDLFVSVRLRGTVSNKATIKIAAP